jgi:signal transduction histidine kinase
MNEVRVPLRQRLRDALRRPSACSLLGGLAVLAVLFLAWGQASQWYKTRLLSEYKAQAALKASLRGNALSLAISRRLALLQGLRAYVLAEATASEPDAEFQTFVSELFQTGSAHGVRTIAIAPDGVVRFVYPHSDDQGLIGYAPLQDPQVRQDVERTMATGVIALSGPAEGMQDERSVIAWQAVLVPAESGPGETYWGLAYVVIDLPSLLEEVELDVQTDVTLDYALRAGTGHVFYGSADVFDQDPVIHLIWLPDGTWELAGIPHGGWTAEIGRSLLVFQVGGLIIAALLAGLAYLAIRRAAELAQAFARQKAITAENARLYERSQRLAVLEERQRIARELHDSVSQALYGIGLGARTARTLLERNPGQAAEPLEYILSLAEAGLAEMRALIFELRPDSLEREGLVAALHKQAAALRARHDLEVQTILDEGLDIPLEAQEALYRVAQEALNNVVKHARASEVIVRLEADRAQIALSLQDDGVGFDPAAEYPGHVGLHTMKERVERLGGVLLIESTLGRGTTVRAILDR